MIPFFEKGDRVLVSKSISLKFKGRILTYRPFKIERSGIYIIKPDVGETLSIKRCVGIGQDSIYFNKNEVFVKQSNAKQSMSINTDLESLDTGMMVMKRVYLEPGYFFFIGDNLKRLY